MCCAPPCPPPQSTLTFDPTSDLPLAVADDGGNKAENSVSSDGQTKCFAPAADCNDTDESSLKVKDWWKDFEVTLDRMLGESKARQSDNGTDGQKTLTPISVVDPIADETSPKPSSTASIPGQLPDPTHQASKSPKASKSHKKPSMQINNQTAARHNKPGDTSGNMGSTRMRGRS